VFDAAVSGEPTASVKPQNTGTARQSKVDRHASQPCNHGKSKEAAEHPEHPIDAESGEVSKVWARQTDEQAHSEVDADRSADGQPESAAETTPPQVGTTIDVALVAVQGLQQQAPLEVERPEDLHVDQVEPRALPDGLASPAPVEPASEGADVLKGREVEQGKVQVQQAGQAVDLSQSGRQSDEQLTALQQAAVEPLTEGHEPAIVAKSPAGVTQDGIPQADTAHAPVPSAPQSSPVEPAPSVPSADLRQWNRDENRGEPGSKQFHSAEDGEWPNRSLEPSTTPSAPSNFTSNVVGANSNGTLASQQGLNSDVRGFSAAPPAPAVRQPDEGAQSPQAFKAVTLDLDPLDMGPLRVRVMMSDVTVNAHIRTEHGALGQGLVQQGHQLESSLRTNGLEMGFLRVTVDQQHQGRGESGSTYQRPHPFAAGQRTEDHATTQSEALSTTTVREPGNGRVSFFA
jgi:flagellar hook-length control protein FliK